LKNAKWLAFLAALLLLPLLLGSGVWAQNEGSARGNLSGVVLDATKATVPGAQVTINGPIGNLSQTTNEQGSFLFSTLIPGFYSIKVQKAGFKVASIPATEVLINKTTSVEVILETGEITQTVEVSAATVTVDTSASAVNSEFSDSFYSKIPLGRGVSSLFYLAPGVTSGLGTGEENPSISGSTGLENLYVADGVSINDPAFGGIGVWSRVYGPLGTGINLSFVKEVQIKTGGFEPQYGHVSGGIVQLVTKSGGTKFFGTIGGYFNSRWMQDTYQNADDPKFAVTNLVGSRLENANYEGDFELGGYVPVHGLRDRLFFFGTFNPSQNHAYFQPVIGSGLFATSPLIDRNTTRYDYAGKLTFKLNNSHTIESTVSGDPSHTNPTAFSTLNSDNTSANSKWEYGTRNWAVRYDGAFGNSLLVDAAFTWGWNEYRETPATNVVQIIDNTQIATGQRGAFNAQGIGIVEPYDGNTRGVNGDITKTVHFAGTHSINVGYTWQFAKYNDHTFWSGDRFVVPALNAFGTAPGKQAFTDFVSGKTTDANFILQLVSSLKGLTAPCTACPYLDVPGTGFQQVALQQSRGRFDGGITASQGKYHAGYINDAWQMGKYVTLNAGVRWEQQRLIGNISEHTFVNMWSPRVGITVDPTGTRKQKIYANFGRYAYVLPLDAALRSLSNEDDLRGLFFAPASAPCPAGTKDANGVDISGKSCATTNALGTVDFVGDQAHFINTPTCTTAPCGITKNANFLSSGLINEPFATGTRMEFTDEFLVGYDREFKGGIVASVRYIDRRLKRVIEDESGSSVEQNNAGLPLFYVIGNPDAKQDIFVNPNELVFDQGVNFKIPTDASGNQLPLNAANAAAYVAAGFPSACIDSNGQPTPFFVFNQFSGFGAVTPGAPTNGSACFPAVNTSTWTDASGNVLPDCTSLAQSKIPTGQTGSCAAFGSEFYADGKPDTYKDPKREYEAVEFEVRKSLSHNWALSVNYRVAQLRGNYEGAFRNDNTQADPGISSLFDFTEGQLGLLANQQSIGPLNSDRKHTFNAHATYIVPNGKLKGFVIGGGATVLSGNPLTTFYAQEPYVNGGEVPQFGRGDLGRAPVVGSVDAHLEYPFKITERLNLKVAFDLFNIVDSTRQTTINQDADIGYSSSNVDFKKPVSNAGAVSPANFITQGFVDPFSSRLSVLLTF
jgi:hypothetical protein